MPSPEGRGGFPSQPEEPNKEREHGPFYMASRFKSELSAKLAYSQVQELIFRDSKADLSVYRFLLDQVSHVAVVGTPPYERLQQRLENILSYGAYREMTTLPDEIVNALHQRRAQMKQQGDWVEGHYRPGKKLDY
jgi:hypothetical protein